MNRTSAIPYKPAVLACAALSVLLAPQAGAGGLGVLPLPIGTSVNVTNTASSPVPVSVTGPLVVSAGDNPAFEAYASSIAGVCTTGTVVAASNLVTTYALPPPSGYVWVIESIDAAVSAPAGANPVLSVETIGVAGQPVYHAIPLIPQGSDASGGSHYAANQTVRYYEGAGGSPSLRLTALGNVVLPMCLTSFSASGYLVKMP